MATPKRILLTGATGYIGGRLLKELEKRGLALRCLVRKPEHLRSRVGETTDVVSGDVLDPESLPPAFQDVDTAYYLIHSMQRGVDFSERDRNAARNFGRAAKSMGVRRIIYLGGLGDDRQELSAHLRSRHEVGEVLRESGVEVLEFRASIIIGSGSISFELIRALVERLPAMIIPRWVNVSAQPIAIQDVVAYLVAGAEIELSRSQIIQIGGADQVSYGDIMREYARQRDLKRVMISVPFLTPRLSSLWLALVTPLYARIGRILVDSMRHPTIVTDSSAMEMFSIRPLGIRDAIAVALRNEDREFAQTRWSDSSGVASERSEVGGVRYGNRLVDHRSTSVAATPETAFASIERIGGRNGWYYGNALWTLRGWFDLFLGGVGMRRGRREPTRLHVGDTLDCWRVEAIQPGMKLRLFAEMKLPGRAWLEFVVQPDGNGSRISQTATFDPLGLWGLAYWYGIWPLHQLVFAGMLRGIARSAEQRVVK